jgi:hypothetical protein
MLSTKVLFPDTIVICMLFLRVSWFVLLQIAERSVLCLFVRWCACLHVLVHLPGLSSGFWLWLFRFVRWGRCASTLSDPNVGYWIDIPLVVFLLCCPVFSSVSMPVCKSCVLKRRVCFVRCGCFVSNAGTLCANTVSELGVQGSGLCRTSYLFVLHHVSCVVCN